MTFTLVWCATMTLALTGLKCINEHGVNMTIRQLTYIKNSFCRTGIGLGMIIVTFQVTVFYNMILAWSLYYTAVSFDEKLPFNSCSNSFNSPCKYLHVFSLTFVISRQ